MRDKSLVIGAFDGLDNRWIVELLGLIDLMAPRAASGMIVTDIRSNFFDRRDNVSFHYLHMVNVVEELETW